MTLTSSSNGAVDRGNAFSPPTGSNEPQVAPAVVPKKSKSLLDVSSFKAAKAQNRESSTGKFQQSQYPVMKPGSKNFFRVHPSEDYRLYGVGVMEDEDHKIHILQAGYEPPEDVGRFVHSVTLLTCVTHKGGVFLWNIKESTNEWSRSATAVAKTALTKWVRTRPNMALSCYEMEDAPKELESVEPVWPTLSFQEILNSAFEGRIVDNDDYPLIKQLQGRA